MFAWDGFVSFWVKNVAFALWIVVMAMVLRPAMERDGEPVEADDVTSEPRRLTRPEARAVVRVVLDRRLLQPLLRRLLRPHPHAAPGPAVARARTRPSAWFADRRWGLLVGFGLIFLLGGFSAMALALITYSIRRMSVSRAFAYSYLVLYAIAAIPGFLFICIAMTAGVMRPERDPSCSSGSTTSASSPSRARWACSSSGR